MPAKAKANGGKWLVLVYQFPKGPGSRRVKVWRRLQSLGAIAIKNSVYVLPMSEQTREDFEWLMSELEDSGAEAALLESRFVGGMSDPELRGLFNAARDQDYKQLIAEVEEIADALPVREQDESMQIARRAFAKARERLAQIEAIDFFSAAARDAALASLRSLDERLSPMHGESKRGEQAMHAIDISTLENRLWVTRRNVRVDRIASAWLIRRWIDAGAQFKFVAGQDYVPGKNELRFDMFDAEFTHRGDNCTFEVLAALVADDDPALRAIADIVHDIDLKDEKFGRPETEGVANLLSGIVAGSGDDLARIDRGGAMFDDLYRFFQQVNG